MVEESRSHLTYFSSTLLLFFLDNICSHRISDECVREFSSRSISEYLLILTSSSSTQSGFLYSELRYFVLMPSSPTLYRKREEDKFYFYRIWIVIFTVAWNVTNQQKRNNTIKSLWKCQATWQQQTGPK